ncbi:MAG: FISUMP domain-containing protein [Bacteroidota bacterium]
MSVKLFISYRRADTAASAGRLYDAIISRLPVDQVFKDVDSIPLGADFTKVLDAKIKESHIVLAIIGKQFTSIRDNDDNVRIFQENDFVNLEISTALAQKKVVIPVLVDGAKMPELKDLPQNLHQLVFLNGIELRHGSWKRDTGKLFGELAKITKQRVQSQQDRIKRREAIHKNRRAYQRDRNKSTNAHKRHKQFLFAGKAFYKRLKYQSKTKLLWLALLIFFVSIPLVWFVFNSLTDSANSMSVKPALKAEPLAVDSNDGSNFAVVIIGDQVWMAENLAVTSFNDGERIPHITDAEDWELRRRPAYTWYNDDNDNKEYYGGLYNWYAVESGKLCPTGWHVPDGDDWQELVDYAGGADRAGALLKEEGTIYWQVPNSGATDDYEFAALPGGAIGRRSDFQDEGYYGYWWSSQSDQEELAYALQMSYNEAATRFNLNFKYKGFSVRCIKN